MTKPQTTQPKRKKLSPRQVIGMMGVLLIVLLLNITWMLFIPHTPLTDAPQMLTPDSPAWENAIVLMGWEKEQLGLYTLNPAGTNLQRLVAANISDPIWSPDRTHIAYSLWEGKSSPYLYVVKADGSEITQLTTDSVSIQTYQWSPDGKWLSYVSVGISADDGTPIQKSYLYRVRATGGAAQRISDHPLSNSWHYRWSADGQWIAYTAEDDSLRVVNLLTDTDTQIFTPDGDVGANFAWSPVGHSLAVIPAAYGAAHVYLFDPQTAQKTVLYQADRNNIYRVFAVGWSPDGKEVFLTAQMPNSVTLVLAMQTTTPTRIRLLWLTTHRIFGSFRVSGNGTVFWMATRCLFAPTGNDEIYFYALPANSSTPRRIATVRSARACVAVPAARTFWDIAPDGSHLVYSLDPTETGRGVFIVNVATQNQQSFFADYALTGVDWR